MDIQSPYIDFSRVIFICAPTTKAIRTSGTGPEFTTAVDRCAHVAGFRPEHQGYLEMPRHDLKGSLLIVDPRCHGQRNDQLSVDVGLCGLF